MDYCIVLGISSDYKKRETFHLADDKGLNKIKGLIPITKNIKHKGHIKSNSSVLQMTINQNPNFNFAHSKFKRIPRVYKTAREAN